MNKGLYFMGWYRDMWNYHPSLPMKKMQMIEDITDIHANMLIWSCLGSGAIGLPYLDLEANDDTPPRLRLYGFMNDREFCEECRKRGIKVFAVLWKGQLWEFGAEFNEDESKLLSLNILRGASEHRGYIGMSELSTNRYPKLFAPIEKYFPDGLKNGLGETVGDYLEEFKGVSLEGRNILSAWLMAPGHDHKCYTPCANKDSYLAYMQRDVEMMIDAGSGGLHIDEYDTQKHLTSNAGCFCRGTHGGKCLFQRIKRQPLFYDKRAAQVSRFRPAHGEVIHGPAYRKLSDVATREEERIYHKAVGGERQFIEHCAVTKPVQRVILKVAQYVFFYQARSLFSSAAIIQRYDFFHKNICSFNFDTCIVRRRRPHSKPCRGRQDPPAYTPFRRAGTVPDGSCP